MHLFLSDSMTSSVQTSDSEDAATEYELSRTVMVTPLDKLEKELLFNEVNQSVLFDCG